MTFPSLAENVGGSGGGMDLRPNTRPFFSPTVFLSLIYLITAGNAGAADAVLTAKAPADGLAVSLFGHNPVDTTYKRPSFTFPDQITLKRVKRSHFVGRRSYESADPIDFEDETPFIPDEYILAVKLGVPVRELNQTSLDRLKAAFADSDKLQIPVENVGIDKIRFQGNRVEMFFIKPGHNIDIFGVSDLILISDIFTPELIEEVKQKVPELNVTSIAGANYIVIAKPIEPVWKKPFFPYVVAACSVVLILSAGVLIYCCCKKKTLKHYGAENLLSQQICVYPSHKPGVKDGTMIQPEGGPLYVAKGCITPLPAQPVRIKAKGLLERRGSNASLTIDLTPSPELLRWDGTPPKESSALEYLLSAGNRLSRKDLRNCLKNSQALYEEFWEIPMNLPEKVQVAGSGTKNRYNSIIPNEHSRIILPDSERDPLSSYINANSLRGYEGESGAYIATQGPMSHTIVDFWRMVWSEQVTIIVMITKLKEKNKVKCENYMPESSSQFGEVLVTIDTITERKGYIVRNLTLRVGNEMRSVLHYWYTDWPDHKPPDSPKTLLEMVKDIELRRYTAESQGSKLPIVVHCSAGIGRTGCFVAISVGMRQIREEHSVDVLGIVCSMRLDRGGMIQTGEQYEFIHHALCLYEKELSDSGNPAD